MPVVIGFCFYCTGDCVQFCHDISLDPALLKGIAFTKRYITEWVFTKKSLTFITK